MKIITKGKIPKYKFKCRTCNTEFEFDINDIGTKTFEIAWFKKYSNYIKCPICNQEYTFDNLKDIEHLKVDGGQGNEQ